MSNRINEFVNNIHQIIERSNQDLVHENANLDGKSPMGIHSLFASEVGKLYAEMKLVSPEYMKAFEEGYIHIHDFDFYASGTTTCSQIPLGKILKDGFSTGHGFMREPNSITSALALTSIIFQANQNMQHGGQAVALFDFDLAPYIRKSFNNFCEKVSIINSALSPLQIEKMAWELTNRECLQACEAFIHNSNSMHSRGGGQVPFISINYGTDTSFEGRMLIKNILLATQNGLGKGETPIFPIQIFKVKEGINYNETDPNYDLFKLSLVTTAKRLFPNYVFIDAPHNLKYYKKNIPQSEIATMGCRTRVIGNVNGENTPVGRGNLSFTTINLPMLAIETKSISEFFKTLNEYIDLVEKQLYERYLYQGNMYSSSFPFLYSQGVWWNGENLKPNEKLNTILKQGTLSIGYIGLAEALVSLTGFHHGESEVAQKLGLEIITFMRKKMDEATNRTGLNYSLLATPAESYCMKALKKVKEKHGTLKGITDKEYFTNSNHIPVEYKIKAIDKIKIEAPYHNLTNAGHITYVELSEDATKNITALEVLVRAMKESGIGYGSFNLPVDQCKSCSFNGMIYNECPNCGENNQKKISRIRRITGYLVGDLTRWNSGKQAEEKRRVYHD